MKLWFLGVLWFWAFASLFPSSLYLPSLPEAKDCYTPVPSGFAMEESDFQKEPWDSLLAKIKTASQESARLRWQSIQCLKNKNIPKEKIQSALKLHFRLLHNSLEHEARYLYQRADEIPLSPLESKELTKFLEIKKFQYSILERRTVSFFNDSTVADLGSLSDFEGIYLSLLKNQFEFYLGLSQSSRKELLASVYKKDTSTWKK